MRDSYSCVSLARLPSVDGTVPVIFELDMLLRYQRIPIHAGVWSFAWIPHTVRLIHALRRNLHFGQIQEDTELRWDASQGGLVDLGNLTSGAINTRSTKVKRVVRAFEGRGRAKPKALLMSHMLVWDYLESGLFQRREREHSSEPKQHFRWLF